MSSEGQEELSWTEWLDFEKHTVDNIPEGAGVFREERKGRSHTALCHRLQAYSE
jgi:hypothetical protein